MPTKNAKISLKTMKSSFPFHKKKSMTGFSHKANQLMMKPIKKLPKKRDPNERETISNIQALATILRKGPPKFLNPIHTYDLFGFFFMYDRGFDNDRLSEQDKIGLFEVTNFYRRINRIERVDENLIMINCEDMNTPVVPFPLIISRLMSLNDQQAYDLAKTIDKFTNYQVKTLKSLMDDSKDECSIAPEELRLKKNNGSSFMLHDVAYEEVLRNQSGETLQEGQKYDLHKSFANEQELKAYEVYVQKNDDFIKNNKDEAIYAVRYKAMVGSESYHTMQHFYTRNYGRMICPDETFYLKNLFKEGFPNPIMCSDNYFSCINKYLQSLDSQFNEETINTLEIETNGDEDKSKFIFKTMDGLQMPAKIKLTVNIFKGQKFIEVIKLTHFTVSEENRRILLSEERKRNFVMNYKINSQLEVTNGADKNFITKFYPGVIPKNEISMNKSKICQYREINIA